MDHRSRTYFGGYSGKGGGQVGEDVGKLNEVIRLSTPTNHCPSNTHTHAHTPYKTLLTNKTENVCLREVIILCMCSLKPEKTLRSNHQLVLKLKKKKKTENMRAVKSEINEKIPSAF